jgi:hypothetical protein
LPAQCQPRGRREARPTRDRHARAEQPPRAALEVNPAREVSSRRTEHGLSPAQKTRVRIDAGRAALVAREMPLENGEPGNGNPRSGRG